MQGFDDKNRIYLNFFFLFQKFFVTFTSPLSLEQGGDVLLHETTFDLRGSVPDYPELWGLTDKVEGETITWSGSLTGEATITRQHSGQAEETVTYHYRIETKITVKKK